MANSRVTLRDVYEITDRIEQKLDTMSRDFNKRISALELWKADLMGKVTMLVGLVSLAFSMLWDYIKSKFTK